MSVRYRKDIDGLRAIAVLSVFGFHLVPWMSGGFVGVDIFFVISGYLIGGIILSGVKDGTFTLSGFYARRCRRIFPALFAMLAMTTVACTVLLFPKRLLSYSHGLFATALSVSNLYFLKATNYFFHSDHQVLLHTWSLGVEEQYYLLFPIFALAMMRFARRHAMLVVVCTALASFGLSVLALREYPSATFFSLPTRAWELLLGVVVWMWRCSLLQRRLVRESCAFIGLAAVVASVTLMSHDLPFPGAWALPPCLGVALLMAAGDGGPTACSRLLSTRPFVFIGLISYSLYLWHWPILVLLRQAFAVDLHRPFIQLAILLAAIAIAWASWRFIEVPFRVPSARVWRTFAVSGAAVVVIVIASVALHLTHGLPQRFSPRVQQLTAWLDTDIAPVAGTACETQSTWAGTSQYVCLRRKEGVANFLVIGDSFAFHLLGGLIARYPQANIMSAAASGCLPLLARRDGESRQCRAIIDDAYLGYLVANRVDMVIISARWGDGNLSEVGPTLDYLRKLHQPTIVTGIVPEYTLPLPLLLAISTVRSEPSVVTANMVEGRQRQAHLLGDVASAHGGNYVSLYAAMCENGCQTLDAQGLPLQSDYGHLTPVGSLLAAQAMSSLLDPILTGQTSRP